MVGVIVAVSCQVWTLVFVPKSATTRFSSVPLDVPVVEAFVFFTPHSCQWKLAWAVEKVERKIMAGGPPEEVEYTG